MKNDDIIETDILYDSNPGENQNSKQDDLDKPSKQHKIHIVKNKYLSLILFILFLSLLLSFFAFGIIIFITLFVIQFISYSLKKLFNFKWGR